MNDRSRANQLPLPPVLKSRRQLEQQGTNLLPAGAQPPVPLPITADGTTYLMAQEAAWLDATHFAVGRWDGSLSIFTFTPSASSGPTITMAVSSPATEGIQMIVWLAPGTFATSNDEGSLIVWRSASGDWNDLVALTTLDYDPSLGVANSADSFTVDSQLYLVVGHANGFLSIWQGAPDGSSLTQAKTVDVRAAQPVNPWGLHNVRGVSAIFAPNGAGCVVSGSEDGNLCVVSVPQGQILSTTVYNPAAQRGINSIAVLGSLLLVANCSVGQNDYNLWLYRIDPSSWTITFCDHASLKVNQSAPQVFNFCSIWGLYRDGLCFFSSTEEGALWMGSISGQKLNVMGYQEVSSALGAALAFNIGGQLIMVNYNLYEFVTMNGTAPPASANPERLPVSQSAS